jgi:YD repeat-containing protein
LCRVAAPFTLQTKTCLWGPRPCWSRRLERCGFGIQSLWFRYSSAYDANGNKFYDIDARGYKTSYVYDALNRLVETDYLDQTKPTKNYDFRNNVIRETDQAGDVTFAGVGNTIYG